MQALTRVLKQVGAAAYVILVTSCSGALSPTDGGAGSQRLANDSTLPSLVECPTNTTLQTRATIGLLGGVLNLAGTSVSIPAGALLAQTDIVLTIPASRYMEIDVSVPGVDHFLFEKAIVVTMDYSRCQRNDLLFSTLQVWHIDTSTKALLEQMPSIDNKLTQTIVFTTGHLSGYALAN
jgi:hypothetical protein